jgi:hypothetical protein
MKNEKEIAEINAVFEAGIRSRRYARRGIVSHKFSGEMPTPTELATLAAMLARAPVENLETLCATALKLWYASHETLALQQQCNADYQQAKANEKPWSEPPENQAWPIPLATFCKILWPGKDEEYYAPAIRAWLKTLPKERLPGEGEPKEVTYAMMRSDPIDKRQFYHLRDSLLPWVQRWKMPVNSAVKSENAKKGWRYCNAKMQETPECQEFMAECKKLGRIPYKRSFKKWLIHKNEPPEARLNKALKKITLSS